MDVCHSRKGRSAFDEVHHCSWRLATAEAARYVAQKERHEFDDVRLQVKWLAAIGVSPSFRAATTKLIVRALGLSVIGLHPGVGAGQGISLSRPSAEYFKVQMTQRPDAVEI
jgi:hypothetical protein